MKIVYILSDGGMDTIALVSLEIIRDSIMEITKCEKHRAVHPVTKFAVSEFGQNQRRKEKRLGC